MGRHLTRGGAARAAALLLGAGIALAEGLAAAIPLPERLSAPGSPAVLDREGQPLHVFLAPDERWRLPAALDRVDPDFIAALVAFEDRRFGWHPGVDPLAVARAVGQNARADGVVSGASTLAMQLVRVVEPRPRTLRSKAIEALRALQIEAVWSREQVLTAYLTFAPYGRNVEGVEAASWALFGHGPEALSEAEIATLLALPQDPNGRAPGPDSPLRAARDRVAETLVARGALPAAALERVRSTPIPDRLAPLPREARHAATWIRARSRAARVPTSLDRGVQRTAERLLAQHAPDLRARGIDNAAIVVAEHADGRVAALVGSAEGAPRGGDIPSFDVARSPGSTLKPLLYARAIEDGLALPEQLRVDVPVRYGTYAPENHDGAHAGLVPLEEALSRSLNVPFVELLREVGVERFLADLRATGAAHLVDVPGHYGLSAAVGGIELSPLEVAGVYVALARGGRAAPLSWADPGPDRPLLSPGAAFLTRRALSLRDRPDFPSRRDLADAPPRIHWKTGTSFGHRDAWAVGSGARYTVAVWLGNLDRRPSVHLVGADAAGPILFDVLEALDDGVEAERPPEDLVPVELCALSGRLPTDACPERRAALALQRRVPTAPCELHVAVEVDASTGERVGPGCRDGRAVEVQSHVVWPARVARWLDDAHRRQAGLPRWAEGCNPTAAQPPHILSPPPGEVILLIRGVPPTDQQVPLEAEGHGDLAWFVDGAHVGTAPAHGRGWWTPSPGTHELVVVDAAGRAGRATVRVEARR